LLRFKAMQHSSADEQPDDAAATVPSPELGEPPAKAPRTEEQSASSPAAAAATLSRRAQKKQAQRERRKARRKQKHAEHVERVAQEGVVTAADLAETTYELRGDGLRRVRPYTYTFSVAAKARWVGCDVVQVFVREFGLPAAFYESQLARGLLTVTPRPPSSSNNGASEAAQAPPPPPPPSQCRRVVAQCDTIANTIHRHEPPVSDQPLVILAQTDDLVVVDKPPSLPVHPCGAFRHNSVLFILAAEHGLNGLHSVHRLDRMTSGVLMLAKSTAAAARYMRDIQQGLAHKVYLARVVGRLSVDSATAAAGTVAGDGDTITVDQSIEMLQSTCRGAKNVVGPRGKPAKTVFRPLLYDGASDTSVVECRPMTGRTHQIRIHLGWLGHPIVNDRLYNPALYSQRKDIEWDVACTDLDDAAAPLPPPPVAASSTECASAPVAATPIASKDPRIGCPWCAKEWPDPTPEELVMWLHAYSYEGPGWRFVAPAPSWALGAHP